MTQRRKRTLGVVAATGILLIAAVGTWRIWPGAPEASVNLPRTAQEGFTFMNSAEFAQLPDYRREAYQREVKRLIDAMTPEQRAAFFAQYRGSADMAKGLRQIGFNPIRPAMADFFAAPLEQRQAVLDKYIDQMERFRALGGLGRPRDTAGTSRVQATPEVRDYMRQQIEMQIQEGNPQETAKMMEFMKAFRARRIERNLPVP